MVTATIDKREAILQATLDLVSERGFHGAPMSMIAKEAGVSAGIIYHYFENKDELITELYKELKRDLAQAVLANYSNDLPLYERFRLFWLNAVLYYIGHPKETAFMEQFANSPYLQPGIEEMSEEYFRPVMEFMTHALREGVIKPLPPQMLSAFTLEIAISLAKKDANGILPLDEDALEMAMNACWDAIKR